MKEKISNLQKEVNKSCTIQHAGKSLVCPNCGMELKLEIKQMTNSDLLNALKTNDR